MGAKWPNGKAGKTLWLKKWGQPCEHSSCFADSTQHSGLRHKFLATLSIDKESNMYLKAPGKIVV